MHSQSLADFTGTDITTESFESQMAKIALANNKNACFKEYLYHLKVVKGCLEVSSLWVKNLSVNRSSMKLIYF